MGIGHRALVASGVYLILLRTAIQELIDNYDFAIATAAYSTLSTPEKFAIARTYLL